MRLTLRTLLAWLDDTLQPAEVREIGKQVAESPYAQELADRIHRVARQRRLSVPSGSGPDGTDANLVASYLDNDLDPATVPDFEKKCLTTDVNLAEVACVHQILSLLGQKVKVPDEAKARMYQLVKGRETLTRANHQNGKRPLAPEPLTAPIPTWEISSEPKRGMAQQFGPAVACLVLIVLASFSAWKSLTTTDRAPVPAPVEVVSATKIQAAPAEQPVNEPTEETEAAKLAGGSKEGGADAAGELAANAAAATKAEPAAPKKPEAADLVPPGVTGITEPKNSILLLYSTEKREWERVTEKTKLNRSDRVLNLSPFRSTLTVGKQRVVLVGETEVNIVSKTPEGIPSVELVHGRLLLDSESQGHLNVLAGSRTIELELAPASVFSVEKWELPINGLPPAANPPFLLACIKGKVDVTLDKKKESIEAGTVAAVEPSGELKRLEDSTLPPWATLSEPSAEEAKVLADFYKLFHPGRPVLADLAAATEESDPAIKTLSIQGLKATGEISLLLPLVNKSGDREVRRNAIVAVRALLARGGDSAVRVKERLGEEFGDTMAADVEKLLRGYPAADTSNRDLLTRLVGWLSAEQESVGVRELAIDNLTRLTGRDDQGYDPDHPAGKGLEAWNQQLRSGELATPAIPRAAK
jgi:hypothetical protein